MAQLKNLGEEVSDNCLIGAILAALPDSFEIFITVWMNSPNQNVDGLVSRLMAGAKDQIQKISDELNALAVRLRNQKSRFNGDTSEDQCRYCKEMGHWVRSCPKKKKSGPTDNSRRHKNDTREKSESKETHAPKDGSHSLAFMT